MRVLDLFSGIGGWSLGLERAGFQTVAACELNPWKRRRYQMLFPGVPVFRDIRKLSGDVLRRAGIDIDIIAGSPPCQDASTANTKGLGIDGPETGLFREAVRLVREVRPRWVCFENVPGLRTRGADRVLGWLEAADYTVWPLVVGAGDLGAPHERKRVWIVAYSADARAQHGELERASDIRDSTDANSERSEARQRRYKSSRAETQITTLGGSHIRQTSNTLGDRLRQQPRWGSGPNGACEAEHQPNAGNAAGQQMGGMRQPWQDHPDPNSEGQLERAFDGEMAWLLEHPWGGGLAGYLRVADGISAGLARKMRSAYGDAVVPIIPELIGRAIIEADMTQPHHDEWVAR